MQKAKTSQEPPTASRQIAFWGEKLQLIREFEGLTQKEMGQRLGVSHALISDYEQGKRFPSEDFLQVVARETGFMPRFFRQRLEDPFQQHECSFRHRRSTSARLKDQVRAHGTLLGILLTQIKHSLRLPAFDVPSIPASDLEEIENAASQCRGHWNLDRQAPILQVGRILERAGVVIAPCFVDTDKIDAFSRFGSNVLVFMNRGAGSRASRWNFDLAHELGHLVMHRDLPTGSPETEEAADKFASAFLLPKTAFTREYRTRPFSWQHLFELKKRWNVSLAALLKRAHDLGLSSDTEYRRAFQYMSFKRWRTEGEPFEPVFQAPELLNNALASLSASLGISNGDLCKEMQITPSVFSRIANDCMPPQPKAGKLLSFPAKELHR